MTMRWWWKKKRRQLCYLDDVEEEGEEHEKIAQKWNARPNRGAQQPSLRPTTKASPSSSSKLMNHILRNKHNVSSSSSSSIAQRKDESIQTTTGATRNNIINNNNNNNNNSRSSNSSSKNSNALTSKLERELYELKKTFETKRRQNESLSGALMEVTNEVKHIDHETSEMYEKSANWRNCRIELRFREQV